MKNSINIIILGENASDGRCEYCGKVDELRPYGKDGAKICYDCGIKPENKAETERNIEKFLHGDNDQN